MLAQRKRLEIHRTCPSHPFGKSCGLCRSSASEFGKIGHKNSLETTRKRLKAIFALLPLLGVTFLLGFFVDFHVAVEYAFVFLNSIQGILLFICHYALDDQVRDAIKKCCV